MQKVTSTHDAVYTPIDIVLLKIALILGAVGLLFGLIPAKWATVPTVHEATLRASKPNIVLIQIDSLRADHMGVYGYATNTTPYLDSLFAKGVFFERAIAPSYLTFQTDAAIFSGLYPSQNGVQTWTTPIRQDLTLLPKMLSLNGYRTAAFVSPSLQKYFGMFDDFDEYYQEQNTKSFRGNSERIESWLNATHESRDPFFVFWHIYDVHLPYNRPLTPALTFNTPFATSNLWDWSNQSKTHIRQNNGDPRLHTITDEDVAYLRTAYDEGVRSVDRSLKEFMERFETRHPEDFRSTLFIITAEHGEDLKEHGFIFHRDLYDVNIRAPLAIIYPKALRPQRIAAPVSLLDITPTLLDMASIRHTDTQEGINLLPYIKNPETFPGDRLIFTERAPFQEFSVQKGKWKYILRNPLLTTYTSSATTTLDGSSEINANQLFVNIRNNDTEWSDEFYNTETDPTEQNNLRGMSIPEEQELFEAVSAFKKRMEQASESYAHTESHDPLVPLTYP